MLATGGGVTVTDAVAVAVSAVAVMVALPAVTPVTNPFGETVATFGALLVHVGVGNGEQFDALSDAESCEVPPGARLTVEGTTVMVLTAHTGFGGSPPPPPHAAIRPSVAISPLTSHSPIERDDHTDAETRRERFFFTSVNM